MRGLHIKRLHVLKPKNRIKLQKKVQTEQVLTDESDIVVSEEMDVSKEENLESDKPHKKNKKEKKHAKMDKDKIEKALNILANDDEKLIKRVKKDKGLIERTESSKIILTEDNRQLLND